MSYLIKLSSEKRKFQALGAGMGAIAGGTKGLVVGAGLGALRGGYKKYVKGDETTSFGEQITKGALIGGTGGTILGAGAGAHAFGKSYDHMSDAFSQTYDDEELKRRLREMGVM